MSGWGRLFEVYDTVADLHYDSVIYTKGILESRTGGLYFLDPPGGLGWGYRK